MHTYIIWDKKSNINGKTPKEIYEIHHIDKSYTVGLVIDENNNVVDFQYNVGTQLSNEEMLEKVKGIAENRNNPPIPNEIAE